MNKHTSFRIGGPADYYVTINNLKELQDVRNLAQKENIPFLVVGNGSNLLVLDKGIRGIVARLNFNKIEIIENDVIVSADVSVSKLSQLLAKNELSGTEFLSGIPGTIGGAIRMNAGAYGSEIKDILISTTCLDKYGNICELSNEEQRFEYRKSIFKDNNYIILETKLHLKNDATENINTRMQEMMKNRREKQPVEYPSAGSTFKRKDNIITAKLIDECGLKGFEIGGAKISDKHAGFIINKGNATAKDILELADYVKKVVYQRFNEEIELEVLVVGEE